MFIWTFLRKFVMFIWAMFSRRRKQMLTVKSRSTHARAIGASIERAFLEDRSWWLGSRLGHQDFLIDLDFEPALKIPGCQMLAVVIETWRKTEIKSPHVGIPMICMIATYLMYVAWDFKSRRDLGSAPLTSCRIVWQRHATHNTKWLCADSSNGW